MIGRMKTPEFKVGERVRNVTHGEKGEVLQCINVNDRADVKRQGFRYYIKVGKQVFSSPEWSIKAIKKRNRIN